ncbi:hypothetical protein NBRGN_027_03260 [Nocardia brasiliensis NBRC 14402]|uniref:hypothetical protein n=1 Tax=Nocardia brasiliensis TaxID=37326 RepID=UPI0002FECD02|nr:hypothetical protein [Nocardia brasiliensis]ASF10685.2 hypothetical protein CEQ30_28805 [Nocardia brasiliensis]GAJ80667.1 hypothetical protein NBRGN_027_03260 [Nocardia brasiliensis NBRC 14402]SUB10739.1 Uncharacterised protein [Nocardia brasiliensis]
MNDPYGRPGNYFPPPVPRPSSEVLAGLAACVGGLTACGGALLGAHVLRTVDRIKKPTSGDPAFLETYDAWKLTEDVHSGLAVLLVVSAFMAGVLALGGLLYLSGKPLGRPMLLIGGAWTFVGGLISAVYGGERGLAVDAEFSFLVLVCGAVVALTATVLALATPPAAPLPVPPMPQPFPAPHLNPQGGQPHQPPRP